MLESSLSIKYRPKKPSDIIGQDVAVRSIVNAFKSKTLHHAYIFAGKFGCGKCITGNSIIQTTRGLKRISDLVSENKRLSSVDLPVFDESGTGISQYIYSEKKADVLNIITCRGYHLTGTPEHPIRVLGLDGNLIWKRLDDITKDDYVAVVRDDNLTNHRQPNIRFNFNKKRYANNIYKNSASRASCVKSLSSFSVNCKVDESLAFALGICMAEGHLSKTKFCLSNTDKDIVDCVYNTCKEKFNIKLSRYQDKRRRKVQYVIASGLKGFIELLNFLGLSGKSNQKRLSDFILGLPRDDMKSFLRGYFEGDGGVNGNSVCVWSTSKRLLQDIQIILLSFGIISTVYLKITKCSNCKNKDKKHISYTLQISGASVIVFRNKIGFFSNRKNDLLSEICKKCGNNPNLDVIPYVQKRIINLKSALNITKSGKMKVNGKYVIVPRWNHNIRLTCKSHKNMTYNNLTYCIKYFTEIKNIIGDSNNRLSSRIDSEISCIKYILDNNLFFDSVISIKKSGKQDVYDLVKLGDDHSFFSNGIISHNTSMSRILAAMDNCEKGPSIDPCGTCKTCLSIFTGKSIDVKEIDAASNRGIDDIRDLKDEIRFAPVECRKKYVIIDEAHSLTGFAAEAALKMIEEPPDHVRFILATTEPQSLKSTILSRCIMLRFTQVSSPILLEHLLLVAKNENVDYDEDALKLAVRSSNGSVRDSLQRLQVLINYAGEEKITKELAKEALGVIDQALFIQFIDAICNQQAPEGFHVVEKLLECGSTAKEITDGLHNHLCNLMLSIASKGDLSNLGFTDEDGKKYIHQAKTIGLELVLEMMSLVESQINRPLFFNMNPQELLNKFVVLSIIERAKIIKRKK